MATFPEGCLAKLPYEGPWEKQEAGAGRANQAWLINNGQQKLVVKRFLHQQSFAGGLSQGSLLTLEQQLAQAGIGAPVVYTDTEQGLLVSKWLGEQRFLEEASRLQQARLAGKTLARIHHQQPDIPPWSLKDRTLQYCDALAELKPELAAALKADCADYAALFERWEQGPSCFCHNDLNLEHIFVSEQTRVIDWEYAGFGHPGFDLASTVICNDFMDEQVDELVYYYNDSQPPVPQDRDELIDWMRLVALVNHAWFSLQQALQEKAQAVRATGTDQG